MTAGEFISAPDRDLMKRLTVVLIFLFGFTAAFSTLDRVYSRKFFDVTGSAQWIWADHPMSSGEPVAFFATRDFDLPAKRSYAHLKIDADPECTIYVNGREVAGRLLAPDERRLDLYDLSDFVQTGRNRIVVAVRAPQGVGGLIASLDIAPETQNWLVTDKRWRIYRAWDPAILRREVPTAQPEDPQVVGRPPTGRWNYLPLVPRSLRIAATKIQEPRQTFDLVALLPTIRTVSGIAVAVADREQATAFDFGPTRGRIRLTITDGAFKSRAIPVRTANVRSELDAIDWNLRSIVVAPGESVVTVPEERSFRYVMVFARHVRVEVVR